MSLRRLVIACLALISAACATSSSRNEPRLALSWNGDLITWTVENSGERPMVIDDFRQLDMGVPIGVWIKVTDSSDAPLSYSGHDDGWYSPWMMWSSVWTPEPLELAPGMRLQHTFTAADLTAGLHVTEPITSERCHYRVRVGVSTSNRATWTFLFSERREIACSALQITYCPVESGIVNCSGEPLPEVLRDLGS